MSDEVTSVAEMTTRRPSWAWRLAGMALRLLVPVAITALAAALGYAYAVYPLWYHIDQIRKTATLGTLLTAASARKNLLGAYSEDTGLDRNLAAFDDVIWSVPTVMTPFVGYGAAPGQQHNAYINRYQFRGQREPTMPKPPGVTRIFLTGASVAFSAGAPDDERTIGAYLQSLLDRRSAETGRRYEVFTFATNAWSSTHERIAIENRVSELDPDLVLELTGVADCLYGERGLNVLWARALTDQYYWDLVNIALKRSGFAPMVDVQDVSPGRVPPEVVAVRLQKNVRLAAGALALANARLHVFLQPAIATTGKPLSPREKRLLSLFGSLMNTGYNQDAYRRIAELLGGGGLPPNASFTDLSGLFDAMPETPEVFLDFYHFGDRGNLMIAQRMADVIR